MYMYVFVCVGVCVYACVRVLIPDLIYTENTKAKHSKNQSGAGKGSSPEAKPDAIFGSITEGIA